MVIMKALVMVFPWTDRTKWTILYSSQLIIPTKLTAIRSSGIQLPIMSSQKAFDENKILRMSGPFTPFPQNIQEMLSMKEPCYVCAFIKCWSFVICWHWQYPLQQNSLNCKAQALNSLPSLAAVVKWAHCEMQVLLKKFIIFEGFERPSAIQQRAIIPVVKGRDVIAQYVFALKEVQKYLTVVESSIFLHSNINYSCNGS